MTRNGLLRMVLGLLVCGYCRAQPPRSALQFTAAEIRASAPNTMPRMRSRFLRGRYDIGNATTVDLIRTAWGVDAANIVGGPDWLDIKRYDVSAVAPPDATPDTLKTMLRAFLEDRFHLAVHNGEQNRPAYVITAGGKPRLQPADGSEAGGCAPAPRVGSSAAVDPAAPVTFVCTNLTMAALAKALPGIQEASGYLFNYPVLDRTGLSGAWNFNLTWSPRRIFLRPAISSETVTIFAAIEKQLGLKLSLVKMLEPVIVIDAVSEPKVGQTPLAHPEFEVADIKLDPVQAVVWSVRVDPGGQIRIRGSLLNLIQEAWGAMHPNRIVGATRQMESTHWSVLAKAPVEEGAVAGWNGAVWNGVDIDSMRLMLRSMLIDRFKLVAHEEDRPIDGYALIAAKPKLRKADSSNRPGCREGPGADGKDPRLTNPVASRLVTCLNMTLAQFAAELHDLVPGDVPVADQTGIAGRYDMTINFSPPALFQNVAGPPAAGGDSAASLPDGAISYFDALRGQLGLKLEARKVTARVLVIDSVAEKPTEN